MTATKTPVDELLHVYGIMRPFACILVGVSVVAPFTPLVWLVRRCVSQMLLTAVRRHDGRRTTGRQSVSYRRVWQIASASGHGVAAAVYLAAVVLFAYKLTLEHGGGRPSTSNRWKPSAVVCDTDFMNADSWRTFVLSAYTLSRGLLLLLQRTAPAAAAPTHRVDAAVGGCWFLLLWELVARNSGLALPVAIVDAVDRVASHAHRCARNTGAVAGASSGRLLQVHKHISRPLLLLWLLAYATEAFRKHCGTDTGGAAFAVALVLFTLVVRLGWVGVRLLVCGGRAVVRLHLYAAELGQQYQREAAHA
tara:strand:- start:4011 stop:4931 length:921 start_codon:yes stop_codon:yes gene_type:complete